MGWIWNQKGYSLITVLLMVTIFTILFLAFLGQSYNSSKQNQVVEKKTQSVTLAEMGVSYFQNAVKAIFKEKQTIVNDTVLSEMEADHVTQPPYNQEQIENYSNRAVELMSENMKSGIEEQFGSSTYLANPLLTQLVNPDSNLLFQIKILEISEDYVKDEIKIKFESIGRDEDDSPPLVSEMTIKVRPNGQNNGGINISLKLPNFNNIAQPAGCSSIICWATNNLNNLFNKTIYSTTGLSLDSHDNINSSEELKIHALEDLEILGNVNNALNLLIETQANAILGSQLSAKNNSKLFVKNNLTTNGVTDITDNSWVYVGNILTNNKQLDLKGDSVTIVDGTAKINDKLNVSSKAKMCVKGNLEVKNLSDINVTSNIGLIVKNKIMHNGIEYTNNIVGVTTGEEPYGRICEPVLPYKWAQEILNEVNYINY